MPRLDLNGNPMDDDGPPQAASAPVGGQGRVDLAGNPIPGSGSYQPSPTPIQPMGSQYGSAQAPPPYRGNVGFAGAKEDNSQLYVRVTAVACVLALLGTFWFRGMFPPPVKAPDGYLHYMSPNSTYSLDQPSGWSSIETAAKGNGGESEVDLTSGSASIAIFNKDIGDDTPSPIETLKLFDDNLTRITGSYAGVQSADSDYYFATPTYGDGKCRTFVASGPKFGIPGKIKGYYLAMSSDTQSAVIVCQCRESDWKTLKRVFQHVINSMKEEGSG